MKYSHSNQDYEKYQMTMGTINNDPHYLHHMKYEHSGLYAFYIMSHLAKYGKIHEISLLDYQVGTLCKALHDIIVRIGYDSSNSYLLTEKKWPF